MKPAKVDYRKQKIGKSDKIYLLGKKNEKGEDKVYAIKKNGKPGKYVGTGSTANGVYVLERKRRTSPFDNTQMKKLLKEISGKDHLQKLEDVKKKLSEMNKATLDELVSKQKGRHEIIRTLTFVKSITNPSDKQLNNDMTKSKWFKKTWDQEQAEKKANREKKELKSKAKPTTTNKTTSTPGVLSTFGFKKS